eukprot:8238941-Alexandrium_andersonii.AAC.1
MKLALAASARYWLASAGDGAAADPSSAWPLLQRVGDVDFALPGAPTGSRINCPARLGPAPYKMPLGAPRITRLRSLASPRAPAPPLGHPRPCAGSAAPSRCAPSR